MGTATGLDKAILECPKHKCHSPEGMRERHLRALWAIRRELSVIEAKLVVMPSVQQDDVLVLDSGYQVEKGVVDWVMDHSDCGPCIIQVNTGAKGGCRRESIK